MTRSVRVLHDGGWIHPGGGARVAVELAKALDAPITVGHTECPGWWHDQPIDVEIAFNHELHDSLLGRLIDRPGLRPVAELRLGMLFKSLDIEEEIVVSSGTPAKWWIPRHDQKHIHYCHVPPPRFYGHTQASTPGWVIQTGGRLLDQDFASYVDTYLANSEFTQARIQKHYHREAEVLHPPVRTSRFRYQEPNPDSYVVHIGRLTDMKRAKLVADAAHVAGVSLAMVGDGPHRQHCERYENVTVYPELSDWAVERLVARSSGGIAFARGEHCGITPKEFQAAGKPVVVPDEPNLHNHVQHQETGLIVPPTRDGLTKGLRDLTAREWDYDLIQAAAAAWSTPRFHQAARDLILPTSTSDTPPTRDTLDEEIHA